MFCDRSLELSRRDDSVEGLQYMFLLRNKKKYLRIILNTPLIWSSDKGVTAYMYANKQMCNEFCQADKISTPSCILILMLLKFCKLDKIATEPANRCNYMYIVGAKLLFLPSRGIKHNA